MKPITREECREMLQTYDALKRTEQAVSEGAPTESTGPAKVVAAVAGGWVPVCIAEILLLAEAWERESKYHRQESIIAIDHDEREHAHHEAALASTYYHCAQDLRRQVAHTMKRQPAPNKVHEPRGGE